ncbi:MAG: DUF5615 family PIN-like protein [Egibacteraceae bacterium]
MRLLIDENLSQRVAVLLGQAGHDAVHVRDLGLLGADDDKVLETAAAQGHTLITADTDFGAMLVLHAIEVAAEALKAGAIVVVESDRLRIRSLPVGH